MVQVKTVDVGKGVSWIGAGWRNFLGNPGMWIVMGLALAIVFVVLCLIPFVGALVASLASPVFMAGLLFAAREVEERRPIELGHLIRGFQESQALNALLSLGGIMVAGFLISAIVIFFLAGAAMMTAMHGDPKAISAFALGTGGLVGLLLVLAIQLLVAMAVVYAVPLVMFDKVRPGEAMRASFNACVQNFLPLLVFGAIYLVLGVIASLPFMLGWLVLIPASVGMLYASYRDCFSA